MIKAERLKELIEKEATVYYVDYNGVKCFKLDKTQSGHNLDILYETKSEAEFDKEFGNVEKTIKMPKLHTWEEFEKLKYYSLRKCGVVLLEDAIYIATYRVVGFGQLEQIGKATEENYIKALRKMKELWLEEV